MLAAAILPCHDPLRRAEELAMVDILSEGRLDVGVGRGNRPVEFGAIACPRSRTASASRNAWRS